MIPHGGESAVEERRIPDPGQWPTATGSVAFWEELGRTVATLGMLEDTLARAFFALSGQALVDQERDVQRQLDEWCAQLVAGLSETLKPLADRMAATWCRQDGALSERHGAMREAIRELADERNRLCHGAWIHFESADTGTVRYFAKRKERAGVHNATRSVKALARTRHRAADLIRDVIEDTRHRTGKPFPGTK